MKKVNVLGLQVNKNTQDIYQLGIENGYDRFLEVVSRGRQLSKDKVDKIAPRPNLVGSRCI